MVTLYPHCINYPYTDVSFILVSGEGEAGGGAAGPRPQHGEGDLLPAARPEEAAAVLRGRDGADPAEPGRPGRRPAPQEGRHQPGRQERLHLFAAQPGVAPHHQEAAFQVGLVKSS